MEDEEIIKQRKEKVVGFFKKNYNVLFAVILITLVILGVYIRYQPLSIHSETGKPGLWDATTNDYTLGPDLDPFLFLRYAKDMISTGSLPRMDLMRNVPIGFDTTRELQMVSYMIVLTYKVVNIFGNYSANFAGAFMPVIFFALTIIAFFFFVREIFYRKDDKEKILMANIIASVSTLFMIIIPAFLSRTIAGIPEKESIGFFFMFLSFYLFLKAWKSEKIKYSVILGVLAGIATALMGLSWGGVSYLYVTISLATMIAFIIGTVGKKKSLMYSCWLIVSMIVYFSMTNRVSLVEFVSSLDSGLATLTLVILWMNILIWNTKIKDILRLEKIKLPRPIISLVITIILGFLLILLINPSMIVEKLSALNQMLLNPTTGRWNTTVAENRQPYFSEWVGSFGILFFWTFIIGSVFLFFETFNKLEKKDKFLLTGAYTLFLFGLMFSRYAPHPSILDGEGFISKLFYYGSALLLLGLLIYVYHNYDKKKDERFGKIDYEYIFVFSLFALTLFTARSAVRLIMVLVPIAPIFSSYLLVKSGFEWRKTKEETKKIVWAAVFFALLFLSMFSAWNYYNSIKSESYNFIPNYYTQQWQKAMDWVRNSTPENSIFVHWWDYGYWVQSIGNRPTVTDGGNAIVWWNYLTGRYILTGDNQKEATDLMYTHNVSYLLIDSSDIGKYGAFSQIGSDADFDRLSSGPIAMTSNSKDIKEINEGMIRTYSISSGNGVAVLGLEEDLRYNNGNQSVTLFRENSGLAAIMVTVKQNNGSVSFDQPTGIFVSNGQQIAIPFRYLYFNERFVDFKTGINATAYIIQSVSQGSGGGLQVDQTGAVIYISPRVMRGLLAQIYLLNDLFGNFNKLKAVRSQPNIIIEYFNSQGAGLGEFVYYNGLQGPIKIWKVNYDGTEKFDNKYLETAVPKDITWKF